MTLPPDETPGGAGIREWLDEVGEAPPGDFSDVVRRARDLPGARLSAQDIEDASGLPSDDAELRARLNFGVLDDFLDAAAVFVAEQGAQEAPPMRAAARPRRRGWAWLGAGMAAIAMAAAVVLGWGGSWGALDPAQDDSAYAAAADRSGPNAETGEAQQRPAPRRATPPAPVPSPKPPVEFPPDPVSDPEPNTDETGGIEAPTPREDRRPSIEALDADARAAWKAGDLDRARRLFERVVSRGRGGERADVAYGDLFTLARRQGDSAGLRRYWKHYVKRFPDGRYIDDAKAGLCRAASGDAQTRCWTLYLEARPRGTYRDDAEAALRTP